MTQMKCATSTLYSIVHLIVVENHLPELNDSILSFFHIKCMIKIEITIKLSLLLLVITFT